MTVLFMPFITAPHQIDVWSCPDACRRDPDLYSLDLCRDTAESVLALLGFAGETWLDEPIPIVRFIAYVDFALRRLPRQVLQTTDPVSQPGADLKVAACGRTADAIEPILYELGTIARRARDAGATHIGWS